MAVVHEKLMSAFHKTASALFESCEFMDNSSIKRKDHVSSSSIDQAEMLEQFHRSKYLVDSRGQRRRG